MTATSPALDYDVYIVAFSGGKDSLACVLHLLECGVDRSRIELWHHDVDGREGSTLMDWPVTRAYCEAVASSLGLPLYFSWKKGGFEGEMARRESPTQEIIFETPEGVGRTGGRGPAGTRGQFPQVSPDLSVRWCSAYLKIDVCAAAIRNQPRFIGARTLVLTGERAEESAARARYKVFEPHRADLRDGRKPRHVDAWRPVLHWKEAQVWEIIRRWGIVPHPAYRLGWGRVSCAACIFGSPSQWASLRAVNPAQFERVAALEAASGKTIRRSLNIIQAADRGAAYENTAADRAAALAHTWDEAIRVEPAAWQMPAGAFGESCGPT